MKNRIAEKIIYWLAQFLEEGRLKSDIERIKASQFIAAKRDEVKREEYYKPFVEWVTGGKGIKVTPPGAYKGSNDRNFVDHVLIKAEEDRKEKIRVELNGENYESL